MTVLELMQALAEYDPADEVDVSVFLSGADVIGYRCSVEEFPVEVRQYHRDYWADEPVLVDESGRSYVIRFK